MACLGFVVGFFLVGFFVVFFCLLFFCLVGWFVLLLFFKVTFKFPPSLEAN